MPLRSVESCEAIRNFAGCTSRFESAKSGQELALQWASKEYVNKMVEKVLRREFGYPSLDETVDVMIGMERGGTDIIELGVPFTDPQARPERPRSTLHLTRGSSMPLGIMR